MLWPSSGLYWKTTCKSGLLGTGVQCTLWHTRIISSALPVEATIPVTCFHLPFNICDHSKFFQINDLQWNEMLKLVWDHSNMHLCENNSSNQNKKSLGTCGPLASFLHRSPELAQSVHAKNVLSVKLRGLIQREQSLKYHYQNKCCQLIMADQRIPWML